MSAIPEHRADYFPDDCLFALDQMAQTAIEDAAWATIASSPTDLYCPGPRKLRAIIAHRPDAFNEVEVSQDLYTGGAGKPTRLW